MSKLYASITISAILALWDCAALYAQSLIATVEFTGLVRTKASFLRQYITSAAGRAYDADELLKDKQRLLNLGLLEKVKPITRQVSDDSVKVIFECREMISTLPVFSLGTTEDTFWCRAGIQSLNLSGRGDALVAYYQYYDRHSIYVSYATDRIRNSRWGVTTSLIKWATIEPLNSANGILNYDYTSYSGYASAIRFLSFRETLEIGLGVLNERFEEQQPQGNELADVVQGGKLLSKVILRSNHLDYHTFYIEGLYNQLNIEYIHSIDESRDFIIVFNDLKYFTQIGRRFNWANRLRVGLATNDENPFAPFVLDSYINIRGVGNRVDRGTGSVVVNTELRYTLFDKTRLAAQGVGFVDFGSWRKPGGNFSDFTKSKNMRAFSGLGFRLIYKRAFDTMFRIDYGYEFGKNAGLVIGIGQYF